MRLTYLAALLAGVALAAPAAAEDNVDDLYKQAAAALTAGDSAKSLDLAAKVIAARPADPQAYLFRGKLHEALAKHKDAVVDFTKSIELDPKLAEAYDRRGSEQFKLGRIDESLADFDRFLQLRPQERPGHWKRGITCYYAGRFDEGRKQFVGYEQVDTNDVENAVWHFLCNARLAGVEKARKEILKIGNDRRVPMMQVYALFAGQATPDDVLAAARTGTPGKEQLDGRLFYAHLYLGLYYEVTGDARRAKEHLAKAADEHKIGHYMWDVARVARNRLSESTRK